LSVGPSSLPRSDTEKLCADLGAARSPQGLGNRIAGSRLHTVPPERSTKSNVALCVCSQKLFGKKRVLWRLAALFTGNGLWRLSDPESGPHHQRMGRAAVSARWVCSPVSFLLLFPFQVCSLQSIFQPLGLSRMR